MNARKPKKAQKPLDSKPSAVVSSPPDEQSHQSSEADSGIAGTEGEDAADFAKAARLLRRGESSDRRDFEPLVQQSEQQQIVRLVEEGKLPSISDTEYEALPLLSNRTSEHEVRMRPSDGRVIKRTLAGFYGQIPCLTGTKPDRRPATPSEYLERQALQNLVFDSHLILEGVNISDRPSMDLFAPSGQPSFVISQPFITGTKTTSPSVPTPDQIAEFLTEHGFEPWPGSYFGWRRRTDSVALVDARPDNFVLADEGVIPIDLQMAYVDLPIVP